VEGVIENKGLVEESPERREDAENAQRRSAFDLSALPQRLSVGVYPLWAREKKAPSNARS